MDDDVLKQITSNHLFLNPITKLDSILYIKTDENYWIQKLLTYLERTSDLK
jgi:hypothetical protein